MSLMCYLKETNRLVKKGLVYGSNGPKGFWVNGPSQMGI